MAKKKNYNWNVSLFSLIKYKAYAHFDYVDSSINIPIEKFKNWKLRECAQAILDYSTFPMYIYKVNNVWLQITFRIGSNYYEVTTRHPNKTFNQLHDDFKHAGLIKTNLFSN